MINHDEVQELLAVYALDAVEGQERIDVEAHLELCPRCSSELDSLRGVTAAMGNVSEPASPELWRRISERLYDTAETGEAPPLHVLESVAEGASPVVAHRDGRDRRRPILTAFASVAAAALVGVLSVNLVMADHHVSRLSGALSAARKGTVAAAQNAPGHVDVTLSSSHSAALAKLVLLNGHGYLVSSSLSPLSASETYQLWGIFDGKPVSIGLMGAKPSDIQFAVASSQQPSELAVTVEPASGAVTPTTPIVASGEVTS